jgi:hypothetical protein
MLVAERHGTLPAVDFSVLGPLRVSLSAVLCGALHATLLRAIADQSHRLPNPFIDLAVTALIVGAGTKPLHDLVSSLQKGKDAKADAKATGS